MTVKIKIKDKLEDNTLDLSFCDLQEVPIREIVSPFYYIDCTIVNNIPNLILVLHVYYSIDIFHFFIQFTFFEFQATIRKASSLDLSNNQLISIPVKIFIFSPFKQFIFL